ELGPTSGVCWLTLGLARYRTADWKGAVAAVEKSRTLRKSSDSFDFFVLAMAHGKLGDEEKARQWYDRAVAWMEKNMPGDEELRRYRAEAAALLKIVDKAKPKDEAK